MRLFCQDESRCGLLPIHRRRITWPGIEPGGAVHYNFETCYGDGAGEPTTGESFLLELPSLNTAHVHIFLHECAQHCPNRLNMVVLDHGSSHKAPSLVVPDTMVGVFFPPYSPERNPLERRWHALQAQLAWQLTPQLEEFEQHGATILRQYSKEMIRSLTASPYFVQAVNVVDS